MALTINTNIASLNAQRNLGKTQGALNKSLQRLSSGLRINSAKDDAAGLAISNRMGSQVRGLNQAVRNANDAISLSQTAEGALQESTSILQRMRELSVQSANDTNTASDRTSIQAEISLDGTMLNATFHVGANAGANQTIVFDIGSAKTADLSAVGTMLSAPNGTAVRGTSVTGALLADTLTVNGNDVLAADGTNEAIAKAINTANGTNIATAVNVQTIDFTDVALDATKAAVGTDGELTSGAAVASTTTINGGLIVTSNTAGVGGNAITVALVDDGSSDVTESATVTFSDMENGEIITVTNGTESKTLTASGNMTADQVATAFLDPTTAPVAGSWGGGENVAWTAWNVVAGGAAGELDFTSTTANAPVADLTTTVTGATADISDLVQGDTASATDVAVAVNAITVTVSSDTLATMKNEDVAALINNQATAFGRVTATGDATTSAVAFGAANLIDGADATAGSMDITGLYDADAGSVDTTGITLDGSAIDTSGIDFGSISTGAELATALNGITDLTATYTGSTLSLATTSGVVLGVTDNALTNIVNVTGTYSLTLDGGTTIDVSDATVDASVTAAEIATAINGETGFTATVDDDGAVVITKTDAGDFTITEVVKTDGTNEDAASAGLAATTSTVTTYTGQISLDSTSDIVFTGTGLAAAGLSNVGNTTTTIDQMDVSTRAGATTAITSIDFALNQIDEMRGEMGAVQNRFESTISNLQNVSENISAARSRIVDADFAAETAALTKSQILQQAGIAMLAQANQLPQAVLSLLQ